MEQLLGLRSTQSGSGFTQADFIQPQSSQADEVTGVPPLSGLSLSSCSGISRARRHSTLKAYGESGMIQGMVPYHQHRSFECHNLSTDRLFLWLFEEKQSAPLIITCYSSMISYILRLHGKCDTRHDKDLSDLLATLELIDSYPSLCFQMESVLVFNMAQFRQR
jgi:hypothetical protein